MPSWRSYTQTCKMQSMLHHYLPRTLETESELDIVSRCMQSFYLILQRQGDRGGFIGELRLSNPWITQYAVHGCENDSIRFKHEALVSSDTEQMTFPKHPFPLCRRHIRGDDCRFVKQTIDHFIHRGMSQFIEEAWGDQTLASGSTPGVLRARIFTDIGDEERRALIDLLFEFKAVTAMYVWRIEMAKHSKKPIDYETCRTTRKFFWRVVHCYAGMCPDFDKCATVCEWGRVWFKEAFAARKQSPITDKVRASVILAAKECDGCMTPYNELLVRHAVVIKNLRAAVVSAAKPSDIRIIKDTMGKIQGLDQLKRLLRGIPMPPFEMSESLSALERAEHLLAIMDFVDTDMADASLFGRWEWREYRQAGEAANGCVDGLIQSVLAQFPAEDLLKKMLLAVPLPTMACAAKPGPARQLASAKTVKTDLQHIRAVAAECAAEVRNMELDYVRGLVSAARAIHQQVMQSAVILQALREDQRRRAIRRAVKRIRAVQRSALAQMLPFAAEQHKGSAVHRLKARVVLVKAEIQALVRAIEHIQTLIADYTAEEAALLAKHTKQERLRLFIAAAPAFLPSAMFEPEVDCGLCLQTLDWNQDDGIGLVTCCREFGYLCGSCLSRPHSNSHDAVAEREIASCVRGVRRALGI